MINAGKRENLPLSHPTAVCYNGVSIQMGEHRKRSKYMMKKRLLSGLLALALLVSLLPAALAAAPGEADAAQALAALDIMVGDQSGNLNLNATVTRAEFTKMAVAASPMRDAVGDTVSVKPYPDVPQDNWAAPWVKAAVDQGLVQGDLHGNFNPGRTITLAEGVTIVLRLLGYADSDFTGVWPSGQMAQYRALKLDQGVTCGTNDPMRRRDALYLFYNLLITKNKSGQYHLNALEPTLNLVNAAGELDQVALINSAMEGPVVASGGWESAIPFSLSTAKVYRGGNLSSLSAIQSQDVVYWSDSMRTIWAYSRKITGIYEAVSPSASAPASVTVAGKTYAIETTGAAFALSDLGDYKVGDNVTLLLGRNEGVAAVARPDDSAALLYGIVTQVGDSIYDDGAGDTYHALTATIMGTDGNTYTYPTDDKRMEAGALVRVNLNEENVKAERIGSNRVTGRISSDGTTLGAYRLADNVEILDTHESCTPIRVYPSRLAGVTLSGNMVRFYALNPKGEITHLILNDVTGDLHQYGIITGITEGSPVMGIDTVYAYDLGGQRMMYTSASPVLNLKTGPCQLKMEAPQQIDRPYNLTEVRVNSIVDNVVITNDEWKYTISDDVVVYLWEREGNYRVSSLSRILEGDYTLTAWYDKPDNEGGRIRVIVAR